MLWTSLGMADLEEVAERKTRIALHRPLSRGLLPMVPRPRPYVNPLLHVLRHVTGMYATAISPKTV